MLVFGATIGAPIFALVRLLRLFNGGEQSKHQALVVENPPLDSTPAQITREAARFIHTPVKLGFT